MQKELVLEQDLEDIFANLFSKAKESESTDIYIMENKIPRVGMLKGYSLIDPPVEVSPTDLERLIDATMPDDIENIKYHGEGNRNIEYAFSIKNHGRYRVSLTTSEEGSGMSIRKLPYYIPSLNDIDKFNFLKGIKNIINNRSGGGMIIHTGATGSGKTTLISAEVDALAKEATGVIITLENPIEYRYTYTKALVRQYEVGRHIASYLEGLNLALRNDPTAIVVGEVRSHDDVRAMVDIAMRGHLVFSTFHTSNTLNALRFLDSMSTDNKESWRQLIAYSIKAIVAQKLIYKEGHGFVLIPEVFIPSEKVRTKISRGEFSDIKDMFYTNTLREDMCFTFKDTIEILHKERVLSSSERQDLLIAQQVA